MQRDSFGKARRYRVTVGTLGSLRRVMPKRAIIVSATAGLVLGSLVAAAPARAESNSQQMDQSMGEALLAMQPGDQQRLASWVDGSQTATGDAAVGVLCQRGLPLCHERVALWPSRDDERYACARMAHAAVARLWHT